MECLKGRVLEALIRTRFSTRPILGAIWHILTRLFVHVLLCRAWFQLSPAPFLATPELNSPNLSTDMGGNEGGGGGERWSFFGTRSVVQKSPTDPGSETNTGERFTPASAS